MEDIKNYGAFAGVVASALPGSVTVATLTAPAPGIAGLLGMTATSTVAVPLAAPVIVGGGLVVGGFHMYKYLKAKQTH